MTHLRQHSLRTDGPFTLRSGTIASWYLDGRQTTLDGPGSVYVGRAVLGVLDERAVAVGGMTMGADPIAVAAAITAAGQDIPLRAFSVRKEAKDPRIRGSSGWPGRGWRCCGGARGHNVDRRCVARGG